MPSVTHGSAIGRESLEYHERAPHGKLQIVPTKPCSTQRDLSLAYTPGVAEPCLAIHANPDDVYRYTAKGNLVAVVSNGTAVLGLGNIGAAAGKPVMEGKGLLFKRFADIDSIDIELATEDADKIIEAVKLMEPTFGGINLEDIKAPECFYIEERLRAEMNIPVMHDDQHGTAIISGAALLNALEIAGKDKTKARIVINGAGASALASARFYVLLGVPRQNITVCDSKGVVYAGRTAGMNRYKEEFAVETKARTLAEALVGADAFVGLSAANCVTQDMVRSMNHDPLIMAMANPDPEIPYEEARSARPDAIVATGRSDYPNQVNNVLGFPFIFRGALDVRARQINEDMKVAAARALAELARQDVPEEVLRAYGLTELSFGRDYLIPKPLDPRVLLWVSPAVAGAAMKSGVARVTVDLDEYRESLDTRLGQSREIMRVVVNKARNAPKRIVLANGEADNVVRAAHQIVEDGIAKPVLLGDPNTIREKAEHLHVALDDIEIVDPATAAGRDEYAKRLFDQRARKGMTLGGARQLLRNAGYYGAAMVNAGDADGLILSAGLDYREAMRPALRVIGRAPGVSTAAGVYLVTLKNRPIFFADATVNIEMDAERMAEIALLTADLARKFDITPRVAMLSFSNFGSARHPRSDMVREAVAIARRRDPRLVVDGEMQADVALSAELLKGDYAFSVLGKPANVLIFPSIEAGHIGYRLAQELAQADIVGPMFVGLRRPVHIVNRGDHVRDIVNLAAYAVVEAQSTAA
ncbi:MAG: NADP-dependent malic enzyme [Thermoflexales bacterium]|nr:NADP-dependent malic enzyme [Thermoflexales bacterium]